MNDKVKKYRKAWIAALRSGEYQQAHEYLQTADGYCCLGVACEVLNKQGVDKNSRGGVLVGTSLTDSQLPVFDALGLTPSGEVGLMRLNDIDSLTFHQIAAQLVKSPKIYFR